MVDKICTNTGFENSTIDGSEYVFGSGMQVNQIPKSYSYQKFLPKVINQYDSPICVPCSIGSYLNWRENLKTGVRQDNGINYYEIYDTFGNEAGMTFKDAFKYLRHNGVSSDVGLLKIGAYAMVKSSYGLRLAILMNGPCFGALPVYNSTDEFWIKREGDNLLAYHAIAIVGYDEGGFIIRNSWGTEYGDNGYGYIENKNINKFIELWTVIS